MLKNKKPAPASASAPKRQAHQVRIIGGQWKRTPLTVIDAEGLRPTPDRVRETVFNWLGHLFDANWSVVQVLDLFAGSGALGFEAASRGAMAVMMVEAHTPAFRQLEQVKQKLDATQVRLQRADALSAAQHLLLGGQRFQLIFLDPPFKQGLLPQLLPICSKLLASNGYLYVEAEQALPTDLDDPQRPAWLMDWEVIRADHAGSVFFHILQHRLAATVHL